MERKQSLTIPRADQLPAITDPERQHGGPQSGLPPPFIIGSELAPHLTVGMDFGCSCCRVSTFAKGAPYALKPHEFSAFVEDVLKLDVQNTQLVHSLKHCLSYNYSIRHLSKIHSAAELACSFLQTVKSRIELHTEKLLAKAVISAPACATHNQREAILHAAADAGITVLSLLNEPTAAALDAFFRNDSLRNGRYLVVSSGVYSFETTVIDAQNQLLEVKSVRGNRLLSGHSITCALAEGIATEFGITNSDQLHIVAERAKQQAMQSSVVTIDLGDRTVGFTRAMAQDWLVQQATSIAAMIDAVLADAIVKESEIAGIILTGEATRLWLLADMLKNKFPKAALVRGNVSSGAAIYAALLVRQAKDWVIWEALASPVVVAQGKSLKEVVAANSPLPISGHAALTPCDQRPVSAQILQRAIDIDGEFVQVTRVSVLEELQGIDDGASVDLCVTATANGTLEFAARHKTLDVNLTVSVQETEEASTIVELSIAEQTQPLPAVAEALEKSTPESLPSSRLYSSGLTVEKLENCWLVSEIVEESSADGAGVAIYDELLWIDDAHVFHLGDAVANDLCGLKGASKRLTLRRGDSLYSIEVSLSEPPRRKEPTALKFAVADAAISGSQRKVVQALLDYGESQALSDDEALWAEAESAITRAQSLAQNEVANAEALYLRALCQSFKLKTRFKPNSASVDDAYKLIVDFLERKQAPSATVAQTLLVLLDSAASHFCGPALSATPSVPEQSRLRMFTLLKHTLAAVATARIPVAIWLPLLERLDKSFPGLDLALPKPESPRSQVNYSSYSGISEPNWCTGYADRLLKPILEKDHFSLLEEKLRQFGDNIACQLLPAADVAAAGAFALAIGYQQHGAWWLNWETGTKEATAVECSAMLQFCREQNLVPCFCSKQAYCLSIAILIRLKEEAERKSDLKELALYESNLASALAGSGLEQAVERAANNCLRYRIQGACFDGSVIDNVCSVYLSSKRYQQLERFCRSRLRRLSRSEPADLIEIHQALAQLTRLYALQGDRELCKESYADLVTLFKADDARLFEHYQRYAEFMLRIDDPAAPMVMAKAKEIGLKLGILTAKTAPKWEKNLIRRRGHRDGD